MKSKKKIKWRLCESSTPLVCKTIYYNGLHFHYMIECAKPDIGVRKTILVIKKRNDGYNEFEHSFETTRDIEEITFEELDLYSLKFLGGELSV